MNIIEIKNLTKSYGKNRGIVDVDLEVVKGEIFGFIGPNGAGKSTTIKTLLSLIKPTSGGATILGQDCATLPVEVFNKIGYLPSEVFYYDGMKVEELLKYSASFYENVDEKYIYELAKELELDLSKKVDELSFGNRKKVGIIQCLLHKPELIILDEPTSGLDPLIQKKFFSILQQANKQGTTIFFSSHVLSEVEKFCDRVAIIKDGKILRVDTISSIKEQAIKRVIFETKSSLNISDEIFSNVKDLQRKDNEVSFVFNGNLNDLVSKLSSFDLINLQIIEPDLEEIFMHYYED